MQLELYVLKLAQMPAKMVCCDHLWLWGLLFDTRLAVVEFRQRIPRLSGPRADAGVVGAGAADVEQASVPVQARMPRFQGVKVQTRMPVLLNLCFFA